MPKYNIRFANYATRAALFELQVEQDTTVGALKAMAEEHLSNSDDLCPMKYFDKWYLEVRVGDRKKLVGIDEGDEGLALAAAGLEDESVVYLEGPMFGEGQAEVGRAIAAVRAQAKAEAGHHALQVQGLMAEMCRRFDAMAATMTQQSEAIDKKFDAKQQEQSDKHQKLSVEVKELKDWAEELPMKKHKAEVDSLLQKHRNRPLKALWEVLNDKANPGIELSMAIIMDRRCGIELKAETADGQMANKDRGTINIKGYGGATPLIMAVHAGRNDVVSALLANGADYDAIYGAEGYAAIYLAAIDDNIAAIELLASYGADVSKPTKGNFTPLHEAAFNGQAATIRALVQLGADLTIVDDTGKTPLQTMETSPLPHLARFEKDRLRALLTAN